MAVSTGKSRLVFDGFKPGASTRMQGGAAAAENASVAETSALLNKTKPNYGNMAKNAIAAAGFEERAIRDANTAALNSRMKNEAQVESARIQAEARKEAAQAQAQGSMFGSIAKAGIGLLGSVLLSDERTKNTITDIEDALSTLRQLRPVSFYYNEEYSPTFERIHHGFIAQEYKNVLPEATYYHEDSELYCIDTNELIALLVRSVQQLEMKVGRLEAVNALAGVKS